MARPHDLHAQLSFAQADRLCRELVPLGERVFDHMAQLHEAGFAAFQPRYDYIESFGETAEELALHRRCVIETAKEWLGQPRWIRMSEGDMKQVYFSPFLQQLRAKRDEANGAPARQLSCRYDGGEAAWRREVDPCQRKLVQTEVNQRQVWEARFEEMLKAERLALKREASRHATGLAKGRTFDREGRLVFYSAAMEHHSAFLGFSFGKRTLRRNSPVFSKSITQSWDLCWVLEDFRSFLHSPFEGRLNVYLKLCSRTLRGALDHAVSGEILDIPHRSFVPCFGNGYWSFHNLDELETVIKAHLYLYSLVAPDIEGGIRKVLGHSEG